MNRFCCLLPAALISVAIVSAQEVSPEADPGQEKDRARADEVEIPLPIVSPRALPPGTPQPLSARQKAALMFHNTFYPRAVANRLLLSGIHHWRDDPEEWPDSGEGFGQRFGFRMGALATRNSIQLAGDLLFHTEPRYDICTCSGFIARTKHAWRRVVVARTDTGGETVGISKIAGYMGTPWITHTWLPDPYNTTSSKLGAGFAGLAGRGVTNMVREFWPELAKTLHMPARFGGQQQRD